MKRDFGCPFFSRRRRMGGSKLEKEGRAPCGGYIHWCFEVDSRGDIPNRSQVFRRQKKGIVELVTIREEGFGKGEVPV